MEMVARAEKHESMEKSKVQPTSLCFSFFSFSPPLNGCFTQDLFVRPQALARKRTILCDQLQIFLLDIFVFTLAQIFCINHSNVSASFQVEMSLKLLSTHQPDVCNVLCCTALPSGEVVLVGQSVEDEKLSMHIHTLKNGQLNRRSLTIPCPHLKEILGTKIAGKEKICVTYLSHTTLWPTAHQAKMQWEQCPVTQGQSSGRLGTK